MKPHAEISPRTLLIVIGSLLALTLLSWVVSILHLPGLFGIAVGLGIAGLKAMLVALFFMELWAHRGGVRFAAITGPLFLVTLISLMLADVWTR